MTPTVTCILSCPVVNTDFVSFIKGFKNFQYCLKVLHSKWIIFRCRAIKHSHLCTQILSHTYKQIYTAPKSWKRIRGAGAGWLDSQSERKERLAQTIIRCWAALFKRDWKRVQICLQQLFENLLISWQCTLNGKMTCYT